MSTPNSRCWVLAAGLIAVWIGAPAMVLAHADILERITALDREIREGPQSAALYLKRGELHRLHRDWPAALADYEQAARLEPQNPAVNYYRGRMWLEAGEPERARPALDRFLAARPDHADALLTRSRALAYLGERLAAAGDLTRAIALLDAPTPEVYLERARLLRAEGPDYTDRALAGLDEGIARLGPMVTLIQFAIELERAHGRYLSALDRLDGLPEGPAGQPAWLRVRGDLLLAAGKREEARAAYAAGLEVIESHPPARRNLRANSELATRLRSSLEETSGNP
jgi:predicted Zn-dependent protease